MLPKFGMVFLHARLNEVPSFTIPNTVGPHAANMREDLQHKVTLKKFLSRSFLPISAPVLLSKATMWLRKRRREKKKKKKKKKKEREREIERD